MVAQKEYLGPPSPPPATDCYSLIQSNEYILISCPQIDSATAEGCLSVSVLVSALYISIVTSLNQEICSMRDIYAVFALRIPEYEALQAVWN